MTRQRFTPIHFVLALGLAACSVDAVTTPEEMPKEIVDTKKLELANLYGGIFDATGRTLDSDVLGVEGATVAELKTTIDQRLDSLFKESGKIYSYLSPDDIEDDSLNTASEGGGSLQLDLFNSPQDVTVPVLSDFEPESTESSIDDTMLQVTVSGTQTIGMGDVGCQVVLAVTVEFKANSTGTGPESFTQRVEATIVPDDGNADNGTEQADERCLQLEKVTYDLSYDLTRSGDNQAAKEYFYGDDIAALR